MSNSWEPHSHLHTSQKIILTHQLPAQFQSDMNSYRRAALFLLLCTVGGSSFVLNRQSRQDVRRRKMGPSFGSSFQVYIPERGVTLRSVSERNSSNNSDSESAVDDEVAAMKSTEVSAEKDGDGEDVSKLVATLTDGEWSEISAIVAEAGDDKEMLENIVADALPRFDPRLVMLFKKVAASPKSNDEPDNIKDLRKVADILVFIMDKRLQSGRDLLKDLLDAGEIRKLDSLIGKAQKENRLDMAFFTVLNMNIKDAFDEAQSEGSNITGGPVAMTDMASKDDMEEQGSGANRLQILQHIYTRCQEEVEKAVKPGVGLLNKLLRTEMPPIRKNQMQHYLSPQSSLTLPDGKVIPLQTSGKALVPPMELVSAMGDAVTQIRAVEKAGGTDRKTAADLVESIRQIAIEARFIIMEAYGEDSEDLKSFQNGLQPVFRPGQKLEEK